MTKRATPPATKLRNAAEAELSRARPDKVPARSVDALLHELQVHQIQLEMQNETLRQVQKALEESRDRYADLYEFAPGGYLTLTDLDHIAEINLTGAALLGVDRKIVLNQPLGKFMVTEDRGRLHTHLANVLKHGGKNGCELSIRRKDGTILHVYLDCLLIQSGLGIPALRIALTDITELKKAEAARRLFETRLLRLTGREWEILALAIVGMVNKDIANHLRISVRTIEGHRSQIYLKTGASSMLELAQQAAKARVALTEIASSRATVAT
jgi:PAS domain S-box-containing protein